MQRGTEAKFWRRCTWLLAAALGTCIVVNSVHEAAIPHQLSLLLFGTLAALGIGNTVLNKATSSAQLSEADERRFRRNQYIVGLVISTVLAVLVAFTPIGKTLLPWLFAPLILLPYALLIRAGIVKD